MAREVVTNIEVTTGPRDRKTVFWRGILVAPVAICISTFTNSWSDTSTYYYSTGIIVAPVALALIFRGRYPSYLLAFNKSIMELSLRFGAYLFLLTDDYPSIEANPKFTIELPEIDEGRALNQFMPLIKWFLAIPLYIFGFFYVLYALVLTFFAWIITSATGEYPEWAARHVLRTIAYINRVYGYAFLLVTDDYPSFSL